MGNELLSHSTAISPRVMSATALVDAFRDAVYSISGSTKDPIDWGSFEFEITREYSDVLAFCDPVPRYEGYFSLNISVLSVTEEDEEEEENDE